MKKHKHKIQQYSISSWAKAGMAIKKLQDKPMGEEHDNSAPHRDDHYLIILITRGSFNINLDLIQIEITTPTMLIVFPGQVHHIIHVRDPQGWAISFEPSILESELHLAIEKIAKSPIKLDTKTDFYKHAVTLINVMAQLQYTGLSGHSVKAARSLLEALLGLVAEQITTTTFKDRAPASRATMIDQSFHQLLKRHYKDWKKPSQYAAALNISVAHLYDTVKGITGNSVAELIQQFSILEAKRLLYFTDLSVKEIGYQTGYNEPVYFGKLFKKLAGLSPLQFRRQYRD